MSPWTLHNSLKHSFSTELFLRSQGPADHSLLPIKSIEPLRNTQKRLLQEVNGIYIFHSMSSKSKETIKTVELLGLGYSFTDVVNTAQETAGESYFLEFNRNPKEISRHSQPSLSGAGFFWRQRLPYCAMQFVSLSSLDSRFQMLLFQLLKQILP